MVEEIKLVGIMGVRRYEQTAARQVITNALKPLGINLYTHDGVFWEQGMQNGFEWAISTGVDVILTIDSDSLFTTDHVRTLLQEFVDCKADAICALEPRRDTYEPLCTTEDGGVSVGRKPVVVKTGHFGLTLLRAKNIAAMPKPWFHSQPNLDGEWKAGKADADIFFWNRWECEGNVLLMSPNVRIGHVMETAWYFDENFEVKNSSVAEWKDRHEKPKLKTLVLVGPNNTTELDSLVDAHERSILIEPLPEVAEALKARFPDATVMMEACGTTTAAAPFHRYNQGGMSSSLGVMTEQARMAFGHADLSDAGSLTVNVRPLPDLLKSLSVEHIDTLIIDAQGMDLAILETMREWLEAGKVTIVQAEADADDFRHYDGLPDNSRHMHREFMKSCGYDEHNGGQDAPFQQDLKWSKPQVEKEAVACS